MSDADRPLLHHVLERQLKRLDIESGPPDEAQWVELLRRVDRVYRDAERGQQLMERAIDISSRELSEMYTAQQSADAELSAERRRLQLVFDSATSGLLVFDRAGRITSVNPGAVRLLGPRSTLLDHHLDGALLAIVDGSEPRPLLGPDELWTPTSGQRWSRMGVTLLGASGRARLEEGCSGPWSTTDLTADDLVAADIVVVAFADDCSLGGLVVIDDRAEREIARERLHRQAGHDSLTELADRTHLIDSLEAALLQARTTGAWPSVLFIDLDHFTTVNDSFGRAIGDRVLTTVSSRLLGCVGPHDLIARVGGDEFVALVDDDGGQTPEGLAERIRRVIADPIETSDDHAFVTASIGLARSSVADSSAEQLLHDAELAMHRVKARGRNDVEVVDDASRLQAAERATLERELRAAIARHELGVAYQPLRHAQTNELIGFEALARWVHPVLGDVRPDRFVPVAEKTGLIQALGDRMFDVACRDVATWNRERRQAALSPIVVHVNISERELQSPNLLGRVRDAMRRHDVLPHWLVLEVTETMLLDDPVPALDRLRELRTAGIKVAIDDFGTGYSSLSYLRRYPIHMIKIDREFISNLASSKQDQSIVRAMVDLAHGLDHTVMAEGVETAAELDVLRRLGCDFVQGYLLGVPMPGEEALMLAVSSRTESRDLEPSAWDETAHLQPQP